MEQDNLLSALLLHTKQSTKLTEKKRGIAYEAIKLFAEKGFSNTSTAEIAKRADVAEATIFKHYGSKENLLLTLMTPYIKALLPGIVDEAFRVIELDSKTSFKEFLKEFLKSRIDFVAKNRDVFQVLVKEIIYTDTIRAEFIPYFEVYARPRFIQLIAHFKGMGEFPNISSEEIFDGLSTFLGGFFISRFVLMDKETIDDQEIERAICFIINGMNGK